LGQDDLVAPPEDSDGELEDGEPPMTEEEEELAHVLQLSREEEKVKWVGLREAMEVS
jgi:hypothetical protein